MPTTDPRVDAYIAKAADFAQPILGRLREIVHATCPDVEETIKWGAPAFMYHGMMAGMMAFSRHASFGLWKGSLILDKDGSRADEAAGSLGKLTSLADLPSRKILAGYIKRAMALNEQGVKVVRSTTRPKPAPTLPPDLASALKKNKKAAAHYQAFSAGKQREYVEWLVEARTEATRERRLATAIEWISEGKPRNWKYMNC